MELQPPDHHARRRPRGRSAAYIYGADSRRSCGSSRTATTSRTCPRCRPQRRPIRITRCISTSATTSTGRPAAHQRRRRGTPASTCRSGAATGLLAHAGSPTASAATATPYRTLVSYKETWGANQPRPTNQWTGTFRDPRGPRDDRQQQSRDALTARSSRSISYVLDTIQVPYDDANLRSAQYQRRQPAAGQTRLGSTRTISLRVGRGAHNASRRPGLRLSSTTVDETTDLQDYATPPAKGTATHSLTLYRPPAAPSSSAPAASTGRGLSANHDNEATPTARDPAGDGQPAGRHGHPAGPLDPNLKPPPPRPTAPRRPRPSPRPSAGTTVAAFKTVTITGTASDVGGVVAGVEGSTTNGVTWPRGDGDETGATPSRRKSAAPT